MKLVLREALLTFQRAPLLSVLSVTTIAFSLFVVGLFGLVAVNLQQALREVAERVEIVAYLLPGTPVETVTMAVKDIEAFPEVQSATYVTEDNALARTWKFKDFVEAMTFVNRVATLAEERGHHPDIEIHWNEVTLRQWTHTAGGVTDADVEMARALNELG